MVILRLLGADLPRPPGGRSPTSPRSLDHCPTAAREQLAPWTGRSWTTRSGSAGRAPAAPTPTSSGPSGVLRTLGLERVGPAEQVRTWNLSSIWRLPLAGGSAWLKVVPPFFAHEGDMLRLLQGGPVPRLLGHDRDRTLLADIPGDDRYDAEPPELLEMVSRLVALQAAWIGRTDELLAIGLPDWRGPALTPAIAAWSTAAAASSRPPTAGPSSVRGGLPSTHRRDRRLRYPGHVRPRRLPPGQRPRDAGSLVLLDWGDCGVGHPLLDLPAFLDRIPPGAVDRVRPQWLIAWRTAVPGSDPDRAAALLAPVASARQALIYQVFLDGIEASEHPYHRHDPADWLARAATLVRAEHPPLTRHHAGAV